MLNPEVATAEDYPFTVTSASSTPKVATVTQSTYSWENGTLESAFRNANVRAKTNGISTITLDADASASETLPVEADLGYDIILDLNGHTLSGSQSPAVTAADDFTLTNTGVGGGFVTTSATAIAVTGGTTTVNAASVVANTTAVAVSSGAALETYSAYIYGGSTADLTNAGGTISLSGGWFRNEPDAGWIADGYVANAGTEDFQGNTYNWELAALPPVATVNGVGYPTWNAAVAAATSYSGGDATVTLQLIADISDAAATTLTHATKPLVLDLNGHVLSTTEETFINPTSGTLTITDSQDKVGRITSSSFQALLIGGSTQCTVSNCIIECTMEEASAWNAQVAVMLAGATMRTTFSRCRIYTTGYQTAVRMNNSGCQVTIDDCEVSAGVGNTKGFYGIINNAGNLTINSGSIWTKSSTTEGNAPSALHHSGANANTTINGGYFYAEDPVSKTQRTISGNYGTITMNGGYINIAPTSTKVSYGSGKSLQDCNVPHMHVTTGAELTYTKVVATTP